ncbi:MAG TPA: lamin tail domain-containing protein [Anaeromyxobacteraceae bacterium]|nr:lamin tail domain-containing protein [Anaeromyxobacteraceae bacterium]
MRRAWLLLAAIACGMPEMEPLVRIVGAEPGGEAVPPEATFAVALSGAIAPEGVTDGRRVALGRAEDLRALVEALESEEGAVSADPAIPAELTLAEGGRRILLAPRQPLAPGSAHVLVVSSRLRSADGRAVLDPEGRLRPFVHAFATGAPAGPPAVPVVTEVRVDAETPEAGGEYAEIVNLGEGTMDLRGHRLAKRTAGGALADCTLSLLSGGPVGTGGYALAVGGAWDGRHALPDGTALYACGSSALLGGIANERPAELLLFSPWDEILSTLGAGGVAPLCATLERILPLGADEAWNLDCAEGEGTPGACNSVTSPADCP